MEIVRAGPERIDDLEPLWESLREHHVAIAPHLAVVGPVREPAESWAMRRACYEEWLAKPGAFVLIAEDEGRPVGYALVCMRAAGETWAGNDPIADLETFAVLPGSRGQGIGRALITRMSEELRAAGIEQMSVAVVDANTDAIRFYERLGLLPYTRSYIGPLPD